MTAREELARHPFSRDLTPDQLDRLAVHARLVQLPAGVPIFRSNGAADAVYLIVSGRVTLEQHVPGRGAIQVENLGGGDLLGLSWLFAGSRWMLDARVLETSEAIVLDAAGVRDCMSADQALHLAIATRVIEQLYHRLERVRLQRLDVYAPR